MILFLRMEIVVMSFNMYIRVEFVSEKQAKATQTGFNQSIDFK
jgi:hypothetical protein